jgi:redox-sensitive bicupin YhaK (pirin superfamily)
MTTTSSTLRDAARVTDRRLLRMMGLPVWEALPAPAVPYRLSDPFILLHEASLHLSQTANLATEHPHRGFDNLWYILQGSTSTGHTTGSDGAIERADLPEGALLFLRTGRGVQHAEGIGADQLRAGLDDGDVRTVLFWVNLARQDKASDPRALILRREDMPLRQAGDATARVLVGDGSPVQLGTPALILDVALARGGHTTHDVPPAFQGFAYLLDGAASFGANRVGPVARAWGPGEIFAVETPCRDPLPADGRSAVRRVPRNGGPFVD